MKKNLFKSISIVIGYYNRKKIFLHTLSIFEKIYKKQYDMEVIVVDDCSTEEHKLQDIVSNYSFPIKLIEITKEEKKNRKNPSCVFNRGFKEATKDLVMIQNPECFHLGNLIQYVFDYMDYDDYFVFPCYNSNNETVNKYIIDNIDSININNIETRTKDINKCEKFQGMPIWYQHPRHNNKNFHFCTVISKEYLDILGGFDERYKDGMCYDDDELIFKIKEYLKLNIKSLRPKETELGVVHIFHGRGPAVCIRRNDDCVNNANYEKYELNKTLFENMIHNNTTIACPKIFHYYWDDMKKFSFLNLYSLRSSVHYHPDYIHVLWIPENPQQNITWTEFCNKEFNTDEDWSHHFEELGKIPNLRVLKKNMTSFLNVPDSMSEIHKSDLFRYKILEKYGGIWSDLDIVYIKKITNVIDLDFSTINFICKRKPAIYTPIGLLLAKRKNLFFKNLFNFAFNQYDKDKYQCMGCYALMEFLSIELYDSRMNWDTMKLKHEEFEYIQDNVMLFKKFERDLIIKDDVYLSLNFNNIDDLFIKNNVTIDYNKIAGFHWYNGSDTTKKYLKEIHNSFVPDRFQGEIFKEKHKFVTKYKDIVFFSHKKADTWATYYCTKTINLMKRLKEMKYNIELVEWGAYCNVQPENIIKKISGKTDLINRKLYIFDELTYFSLFVLWKSDKDLVQNFLTSVSYHVFFCELFCTDDFDTIGGPPNISDFAKMYFINARKIFLCNTQNITFLIKKNITYDKIVYFPLQPFKDMDNNQTLENEKDFDIIFYGNVIDNYNFVYRKKMLEKLEKYGKESNKNIVITDCLYHEEKFKNIFNSKIVLHIPSHEKLNSFPWAKVSELMKRKVFFIVEENEEMYIRGLDKIVIFYKMSNFEDLKQKLEYYLEHPEKRIENIQKCHEYFESEYSLNSIF